MKDPFTTMMSEVQYADIIIVDPSNYAVAIKFDEYTDEAPMVIAKGIGPIAINMQQLARKHDVHSIVNSKLAQSLYAETEVIGSLIPKAYYLQIAEVLAHVYQLIQKQTTKKK